MPTAHIVAFYERIAPALVPFRTGRCVALRQVVDGQMVFRRHDNAGAICAVLDALALPYLLTFSGEDGFHVLWSFGPVTAAAFAPRTAWEFERDVVEALRERAEMHLVSAGLPSRMST
jgi:DNA primase